ncbi:phage tail protein, partial [Serratia marcescens]|nr:phage tail protein [Serratia marcescens]
MEDCTVPEPEVFNWIPREGMETTRKPSVITVKFGDGYEQRRAGGLNADLKTFKPVFRVTDEYSRAALDSFLS